MLLYAQHITPRLQYTVDFISKELFDEPITITKDKNEFITSNGPKINYSEQEFSEQEFFILSTPLLFEAGIRQRPINCFELNYYKVFFHNFFIAVNSIKFIDKLNGLFMCLCQTV